MKGSRSKFVGKSFEAASEQGGKESSQEDLLYFKSEIKSLLYLLGEIRFWLGRLESRQLFFWVRVHDLISNEHRLKESFEKWLKDRDDTYLASQIDYYFSQAKFYRNMLEEDDYFIRNTTGYVINLTQKIEEKVNIKIAENEKNILGKLDS